MAGLSHRSFTHRSFTHRTVGLSLLAALLYCGVASAQESDRGFGFLEQLFGNSDRSASEQAPGAAPDHGPATGRVAQSGGDLGMRLDRLEAQIRQLTGAIEQLQYRNQQLEGQLRRMQPDGDYRGQDGAARAAPTARPQAPAQPQAPYAQPQAPYSQPQAPYSPPPAAGGRRGDAFDPSINPSAPGAPRPLGTTAPSAPLAQAQDPEEAVGAPGGRSAGAPLDLSTLTGRAETAEAEAAQRNPGGGTQVATLPPSNNPKDTYDLGYGYV